MYQERIFLSSKDILEKEFKVDAKGYRPQEVDKYLDVIIRDYEEYNKILKDFEQERKELIEDNIKLKQEVRRLRTQLEALKEAWECFKGTKLLKKEFEKFKKENSMV